MSSPNETDAASTEVTWNYGSVADDAKLSNATQRLRLVRAALGDTVYDDELDYVVLVVEEPDDGNFVVNVNMSGGKGITRKASGISIVEEDDEEEDAPVYPITHGLCRWEYKGDGVPECYKKLYEDELKELMKAQQATVGTILMDDCFGRAELVSQPSGCDMRVKILSTGEERMRTAWHLFVEEPEAPLLDAGDKPDAARADADGTAGAEATSAQPTDVSSNAAAADAANADGTTGQNVEPAEETSNKGEEEAAAEAEHAAVRGVHNGF